MGRSELLEAVRGRDGSTVAFVPQIWQHALHLEQIDVDVLPMEPESIARALRNMTALYGVDAVTLGADAAHLAVACYLATSSMTPNEAWQAVQRQQPLEAVPDPRAVAAAEPVTVIVEVARRLRATLGDRAGIAVVIPDPTALAAQLGLPGSERWAERVTIEAIRSIGEVEPELVLVVGPETAVSPRLATVCEFFGAAVIHIGAAVAGVTVLDKIGEPAGLTDPEPGTWMLTTRSEVATNADPAVLRSALTTLRAALRR